MIARSKWQVRTVSVLERVFEERTRQVVQYGLNEDIYDGSGPDAAWLLPFSPAGASKIERELRDDYEDFAEDNGAPTWVHLVREEVAEAFAESDPDRLMEELVQVAALCVSWVERLEDRGAKPVTDVA